MPEHFSTIEDVRQAAAASAIAGSSSGSKAEKMAWIFGVLNIFAYARRTRDEKGLIREFLQGATGYSRAQVARYIAMHQKSAPISASVQLPLASEKLPVTFADPIGNFSLATGNSTRYGSRLVLASMLTLLFAVVAPQGSKQAALTLVHRPAQKHVAGKHVPRVTLVSTIIGDAQNTPAISPLIVFDDAASTDVAVLPAAQPENPADPKGIAAVPKQSSIVTFTSNVAERRKERLMRQESLHAAASIQQNDLYAFGPGMDGQVLTIVNGKMVWKNILPSIIDEMRKGPQSANDGLHGSATTPIDAAYSSFLRGIGRKPGNNGVDAEGRTVRSYGGGGGNQSTESTNTTTTIIQTSGGTGDLSRSQADDLYWALLGNEDTDDSLNFLGTTDEQDLVFRTNNVEAMRLTTSGNAGIGTDTPGSALSVSGSAIIGNNVGAIRADTGVTLEVLGTASGNNLFASKSVTGSHLYAAVTFGGAGLTDCDTNATSKLLWSADSKTFLCGTDQGGVGSSYSAGQGLSLSLANTFSLNATISGSLVRFNTLSGSVVFAKTSLGSSGSLAVEGNATIDDGTFFVDASSNKVGIGTRTGLTATLEVIGTASGTDLFASKSITGSNLYAAVSFAGAGLTDCDTAGTSKLLWDATNKTFSCGTDTDTDTNTTYTAGQGLSLNGTTFSLNATISGALVRFTTLSGSTLYAKNSLASSGSLVVAGAAMLQNNLTVRGALSGNTIFASKSLATSGALVVKGTSLFQSNITLRGTLSGQILHAEKALTSSGSLRIAGVMTGATAVFGAGLGDCDTAGTSKLLYDSATGRFSCGTDTDTDTNTTYQAGQGLVLNGTVFTLNSTISGSLLKFTTVSGSVLYAKTSLASSGSLVIAGTAMFQNAVSIRGALSGATIFASKSLASSGSLTVAGSTTLQNNLTVRGALSGATIFAMRSLSTSGALVVKGTSLFQSNITLRGTLSGTILHAEKALTSSGSLRIAGAMTGATAVYGAGLQNCDPTTGKLAWDAATGRFTCGTDANTGTTYQAGQGLSLNGSVFTLNSTITGALVRFTTLSGSTVYAKTSLASSGSLVIAGTSMFQNAVTIRGALSGATIFASKSLSTSGALVVKGTTTLQSNLTLRGALSGTVLHAEKTLSSSGTLVVESGAYIGRSNSMNNAAILYVNGRNDRVGINTVNPVGTLDIKAGGNASIYLEGGGDSMVSLQFLDGGNEDGYIRFNGDARIFEWASNGGSQISVDLSGTLSGTILHANTALTSSGSLRIAGVMTGATALWGAGLSDCDDGTNSKLLYDSTTGRFSCGADQSGGGSGNFGSGNVVTLTGRRYVDAQGDTMTGGLLIQSGVTHGTLPTIDTGLLLEIAGTASGRVIHAQDSLRSSGSLIVTGAATFNGSSFRLLDSSFANCTALETSNGVLTCGVDNTAASGLDIATADARYVQIQGDTMTGGLLIQSGVAHGTLPTIDAGVLLEVAGTASGIDIFATKSLRSSGSLVVTGSSMFQGAVTMRGALSGATIFASKSLATSGSLVIKGTTMLQSNVTLRGTLSGTILHAEKALTSSGSLRIAGVMTGATAIYGAGLQNCDPTTGKLTYDSTTGRFTCGTDANTGTTYQAGQGLSLNGSVFTLNSTITGSLVRFTTLSGSTVYAKSSLASSGSLVIAGTSMFQNAVTIRGALSGATIFASKSLSTSGALVVKGASLFQSNITLRGTLSGTILHAEKALTSSGSLRINGVMTGATAIWGAGLVDCKQDATSKLTWDVATGRFGCGTDQNTGTTYQAGQGLALNGTVFTLNSTITGSLVRFSTVSGSTVFANKSLASSGTLVVVGASRIKNNLSVTGNMSGQSLVVSGTGFTTMPLMSAKGGYVVMDANIYVTGRRSNIQYTANVQPGGSNFGVGVTFDATRQTSGGAFSLFATASDNSPTGGGALAFYNVQSGQTPLYITSADNVVIAKTLSGSILHANKALTSSGSLRINGVMTGATAIWGAGLVDCKQDATSKLTWDVATGRFGCGTDQNTGTTYQAGQGLSLNGSVFTLNSTITGSLVRFTTISGSTVFANKSLASSGTLVVGGVSSFLGSATIRGALSGNTIFASKSLATSGSLTVAGSTMLQNNLTVRGALSGATIFAMRSLSTSGALVVKGTSLFQSNITLRGTLSGTILHAEKALTSSGSLRIAGVMTGATAIYGAGLGDCDDATSSKLLYDSSTGRFSCGSDQATGGSGSFGTGNVITIGDSRYVSAQGDTMSGGLLIVSGGNGTLPTIQAGLLLEVAGTMSGRVIHAENTLSSSGTIVLEDAANGGAVNMRTGTGNPNGVVTAPRSSLFFATDTGKIWKNNDGVTQWVEMSTGSGSMHMTRMTRDAAQSIPYNMVQKVYLDTETYDVGNIANITAGASGSGRVTIKKAGKYLVQGSIALPGLDLMEYVQAYIFKNNSSVAQSLSYTAASDATVVAHVADVLDLAVGDYLEFFVYNGEGAAQSTPTGAGTKPRFSVTQIQDSLGAQMWTLSGSNLYSNNSGNIGIGTQDARDAKLEVVGTISGSSIYSSGLISASGGLVIKGTTMLQNNLTVRGALSGATIFASKSLATSGALVIKGTTMLQSNVTLRGTLSGTILHAEKALTSSGSLRIAGVMTGATAIYGAGLGDCDDATASKLLYDSSTGRFSCGADQSGGGSGNFGTGNVITIGDRRYVNVGGDTMSGGLLIVSGGNGTLPTIEAGLLLEVAGTMSGRVVHAQNTISSSGTIVLEDAANAGAVSMRTGTGNPNGSVTAPRSSLFFATDTGKIWKNNDGATQWVEMGTGSGTTHMAKMRRDAAQALNNGSATKIAFDAEEFDVGNIGDFSTNDRFDIKKAGKYIVTAQWRQDTSAMNNEFVYIYKNGTSVALNVQASASQADTAHITEILDLAVGDYIEMYVYQDGGALSTATTVQERPRMSVVQLQDNLGNSMWTLSGSNLYNNNSGNIGIGTRDARDAKLEVVGTISGSSIYSSGLISASGGLVIKGVSMLQNNLTVRGALSGATIFASKSLATSGALVIKGTTMLQSNVTLRGTLSGTILHAEKALTSSGSLRIAGVMTGATAVYGAGLGDCDDATNSKLLYDSATGRFSCGADQTGGAAAGIQDHYVRTGGDTMTGGLLIVSLAAGGTVPTIDTGLLLEVAGTMSGRLITATNGLSSSGTLVVKKRAGTNTGAILVVDHVGLVYEGTNRRVGIGTNAPKQVLSLSKSGADTAIFFQTRNVQVLGSSTNTAATNPGTAADDNGVGTIAWTNTANALTSDDSRASATLNTSEVSHYLKLTNFGFSIPTGSTIIGILVRYEKQDSSIQGVLDNRVRIVKGGSIGTTDKSDVNTWQFSDQFVEYGGAADLWGETWTASDINGSTFGTALSATCASCFGTATAEIDSADITVYYAPLNTQETWWTMGADYSDSGVFKLSNSGSLGNRDFLTVTGSGTFGIDETSAVIKSANLPAGSLVIGSGALCVDNGGGNCNDAARAGGAIYAETTMVTEIDVAENYPTRDALLEAGDVAELDPARGVFVRRGTAGTGTLVGIVSTKPGILLGGFDQEQFARERNVPIALSGRVPVKVTATGGNIRIGDMLTASDVPGVARLAQPGEQTIGYALQPHTGTSANGLIQVFVNVIKVDDPGLEVLTEMHIDSETTSGSTTLFSIMSDVNHDENTVFRVTATGSVYADGAYYTTGADYAEWFRVAKSSTGGVMKPGELVCIDVAEENAVRRCDRAADDNLMGIVSTHPAFIGNHIPGADASTARLNGYTLVGLIGQVPALVTDEGGAIRAGDELTAASIPGYARRAAPGEATVGVAMEYLDEGTGIINVLISRRNSSVTVETVEAEILKSIADMEIEDEVNIMVQNAIDILDLNDDIATAVTEQLANNPLLLQMQASLLAATQQNGLLGSGLQILDELAVVSNLRVGGDLSMTGSLSMGGSLNASTISTTGNATLGGDTRIAGDLYVDGAFNIEELFVPGMLKVDGGMDVTGTLNAGRIVVGTGSVFDGSVTINGNLKIQSGSLMFASGSTLDVSNITVRGALRVVGPVTIESLATFLGDVDVHGALIVSGRQAGYASIAEGADSVTVLFGTGFALTPVVTASPDTPVLYAVSRATGSGFTIRLAAVATEKISFSWLALVTAKPGETEGLAGIPVYVDTSGLPILDSLEANGCLRNMLPLDASGRPISCDPYHDDYDWFLDSLGIRVRVNPSLTPQLQPLPEGYVTVVDEDWTFEVPETGTGSSVSSESSESSASSESSVSSEQSSMSSESSSMVSSESSSFVSSEASSEASSESSEASSAASEQSSEEQGSSEASSEGGEE